MNLQTRSTNGSVVFYNLDCDTDLSKVRDGLKPYGFEKFLPERREGIHVLREALQSLFSAKDYLVRGVKVHAEKGHGLAVVREAKGDHANEYETVLVARLSGDGIVSTDPETPEVFVKYLERSAYYPAENMSQGLVKIIEALNGTTLRDRGGVYWMLTDFMETFRAVAKVVEGAAVHSRTRIDELVCEADPITIRSVKINFTDNARSEAEKMIAELCETDPDKVLGERGIEFRRKASAALLEKTRLYEQALGEVLTDVREAIEGIEAAASAAALSASTQSEAA